MPEDGKLVVPHCAALALFLPRSTSMTCGHQRCGETAESVFARRRLPNSSGRVEADVTSYRRAHVFAEVVEWHHAPRSVDSLQ